MKTCQKLGLSLFDDLGVRLGVPDAPLILPLPELIGCRFRRKPATCSELMSASVPM